MGGMPAVLKQKMEKQGYHFVGKHSAVKICEYTANGLRGGTLCYKYSFYGIRSWQCIQQEKIQTSHDRSKARLKQGAKHSV